MKTAGYHRRPGGERRIRGDRVKNLVGVITFLVLARPGRKIQ